MTQEDRIELLCMQIKKQEKTTAEAVLAVMKYLCLTCTTPLGSGYKGLNEARGELEGFLDRL